MSLSFNNNCLLPKQFNGNFDFFFKVMQYALWTVDMEGKCGMGDITEKLVILFNSRECFFVFK